MNLIHTSLSPNTTRSDLTLCLKYLLPWNWLKWGSGTSIAELEGQFSRVVGQTHAVSFFRGAQALFAIFQSLGIKHGDEVILQAYTCFVVPNAIQFTGAIPIYADTTSGTLNIDPDDIEKKITPHTKAIIIQHTFGNPARVTEIKALCRKHHIYLIEDCAHTIGSTYNGQLCGTFGDASLWSFGRDKVISGVFGGMATTNNPEIATALRLVQREASHVNYWTILQSILHPLIFSIAKPIYQLQLGKFLIKLCQTLKLIPLVTQPREKEGKPPIPHPAKMPNFNAAVVLNQLSHLKRFNEHRKKIAHIYHRELSDNPNVILPKEDKKSDPIYLRYTILVKNTSVGAPLSESRVSSVVLAKEEGTRDEAVEPAGKLIEICRKQNIFLGDWSNTVIAPKNVTVTNFQYQSNCPIAEKEGLMAVNLPTHGQITEAQALKLSKIINKVTYSS